MEWAIVVIFVVFIAVVSDIGAAKKRKRVEEATEGFNPIAALGSAREAIKDDLKRADLFKRGGLNIGFFDGWRDLFMNNNGHILVCAGARMGKLVFFLGRLIATLPKKYALCLFDMKAEMTCIFCHFLKASGRAVYVLNPYGILLDRMKGLTQATFNPMSSLDPKSGSFHADCDSLTDAICDDEVLGPDSHWIESAKQLISGVIAALKKYGAAADQNLVAVRSVMTAANGHSVFEFSRECMALPDIYIRQKLGRFTAVATSENGKDGAEANGELRSIISCAETQTGWIGNEAIAENLKGGANEIDLRELKRRKPGMVVSTCLPLHQLAVSRKWFRVLAATLISVALQEEMKGKGTPLLAVLDEISQIGFLKVLANAWGMAAGAAGLQLCAVYQDVSQIQAQFKTSWQTMVQNSGAAVYFGIRDYATAEFVSKQCGITEVLSRSHTVSIDPRTGEPHVNDSATQTARPLLHADEVRFGLRQDEMLLFCDRVPGVIRAKRRPYFECPDLKGKYRDNPYFQKHGGGWLRSLFG
jgi:type IV secretion system protein VirD4